MPEMIPKRKISRDEMIRILLFVSFCVLFGGVVFQANHFWKQVPAMLGQNLNKMGISHEGAVQVAWNFPKGFEVSISKALFRGKTGRFFLKDVSLDIRYIRLKHRINFVVQGIDIEQAVALDPMPNHFEKNQWRFWREPLLSSALMSIPYAETELASLVPFFSYSRYKVFLTLNPSRISIDELILSDSLNGFSVREKKTGKLLEKEYRESKARFALKVIEDFERQKREFEFEGSEPEVRIAGETALADLSWISFEGQINGMPAMDFNRFLSNCGFFNFSFRMPEIPSGEIFISAEGVAREAMNKFKKYYLALQAQGALDVRNFKINSSKISLAFTKEFSKRPGFWALQNETLDKILNVDFSDLSEGKLRTAFEISPDQLQIVEFYMENKIFKAGFIRAPWIWNDHTLQTAGQLVFSEKIASNMIAAFPFLMAWVNDQGRILLPLLVRISSKEIKIELEPSEIDAVYRIFLKPLRFIRPQATTYQEVRIQLNQLNSKGNTTS